jgi:hypothetical protein
MAPISLFSILNFGCFNTVGSFSLNSAPNAHAVAGPIYDFQGANYDATNGQWTNAGSISETVTVTAKIAGRPLKNATPASVEFNGSTNGYQFIVGPEQTNAVAQAFTISAWFKTTSGGGKIIGMEGNNVPESGANGYDKNLYVDLDGKLAFATQFPKRITSTALVNNNQWQHAVATYTGTTTAGATSNEVKLYLNGQLVGTQIGAALVPTGYWRIGGYTMNGWTSNGYYSGSIGQVSIYNRALSQSEAEAVYPNTRSPYTGLTPTFGTPTTTANGFTVQISNYDAAYTHGPVQQPLLARYLSMILVWLQLLESHHQPHLL